MERAIKFQLNESKISLLKFWAIIFIVDIFALFVTKYTSVSIGITQVGNGNEFSLLGFNILPIIVYIIVYNYELYYKQFPIALSFSVIRKDFFKSMILKSIVVTFIFAVIQSILMKLDPILVKFIGKEPIYDFKVFNIGTDGVIFMIVYFFIALLLFSTIWNLIAAINYKFGAKIWIVFAAVSILGGTILNLNLFDLIFPGDWLNVRIDPLQFSLFSIIIIILYIGIYLITTNTNIKHKP